MQNGWAHYNGGEDVVFGIDASKTVWVRGEAKGGVVGTTVLHSLKTCGRHDLWVVYK